MRTLKPLLLTAALASALSLGGCSGAKAPKRENPILGGWRVACDSSQRPFCPKRKRQEVIRFRRNGTYSYGYVRLAGRWRLAGSELRLREKMSGIREVFEATFSRNGQKLTLQRGKKRMVLVRLAKP